MIENYKLAKHLTEVFGDCYMQLNETIRVVQENCTEEEFEDFRRAVGRVMGYLYTDVEAPIYKMHPDLEPEGLSD